MFNETDIQQKINQGKAGDYTSPETIKFPIHVFPKSVQDYIIELNKALNYNVDFCSVGCMFTFATANGNCYKLRVKNTWLAPTIFWFVAVGESGTMKTHPLMTMIKPLEQVDDIRHEEWRQEIEIWETLNAGKKTGQQEPRPTYKQIILNDYTLESLHLAHTVNPRGLGMFRDEIRGFLNDMNKYRKGSDQQFWLESFNNNKYIINRVSKDPMMINNINVNLIGSTQPETLNDIIRESNGDGLVERFLYTLNERNIYPMSETDIDKKWINWWQDSIKLFERNMDYTQQKIIEMDKRAFSAFLSCDKILVEMQNSDEEVYAIKNYLSKMKTYLPRFALLFCLMDNFFQGDMMLVTEVHIKKSWEVIQYFIKSARFIFTETDRSNEIKEVSRKFEGSTKREKIINLSKKGYKNTEIAKLLNTQPSYVSKTLAEI